MTPLHPSEHRVGTVKFCKSCNRMHMFPRWQAGPRELPPAIPLVRLANYVLGGLIVWMFIVGWAVSELVLP